MHGHDLTPEAVAFLKASAPAQPWPMLTPGEARAQHLASRKPDLTAPDVATCDLTVVRPDGTGLALRVYGHAGGAPVLVFFHGGGWVYGDLDMADGFCRRLAHGARVTVCSVDYRLAPEHPFPEPLDDAVLATTWASEQLAGGGPVAVVGSSAGGNLAAATSVVSARCGAPLVGLQVLMCPVTDCRFDTPSHLAHGTGKFLETADMRWYWTHYLGGADPDHAVPNELAAVLRADVHGVAPALVITAEYDVLRDEGEAYAKHLADAGVDTRLRRFEGLIHAFAVLSAFTEAQGAVIAEIGDSVDRHLRPVLRTP